MLERLVKLFIVWARRRADRRMRVVTFQDAFSFSRFEFAWPDEWPDSWLDKHLLWEAKHRAKIGPHAESQAWTGMSPDRRPKRPPFWRPFNLFLHCWDPRHDGEEFHDHPRWSVTLCLRGQLVERTPWSSRTLRPGSMVFRSRKAIHAFSVDPAYRGKTWTLFIVGRRNHRQNSYSIRHQ